MDAQYSGINALASMHIASGSASTFAWFEAASSTQKLAGTKEQAVNVTNVGKSVEVGDITINFNIALSDVSDVELTDATGEVTKYMVGGTPYTKSTPKTTGTWVVTASYDNESRDKPVMIAGLNGVDGYYKFQAKGQANVRLLDANNATDEHEQPSNQLAFYVRVDKTTGALTVTAAKSDTLLGTQYYAVRANNEAAEEYVEANFTAIGSITSSTTLVSNAGHYYKLNSAQASAMSAEDLASAGKTEIFLHADDSIDILDIADD